MGALFVFPPPPAERCHALAGTALAVAARLPDQHAPVLAAAAQLLELDDGAFAKRLDRMRDAEGGALVHELCIALRHAATDLDLAHQAVFVARSRIAAAIASYGGCDER